MRRLVLGVVVAVATVGCYDARQSCEYTCVSSNACPDGLMCNGGHCVTSASETCTGGSGDGGNGSDSGNGSGWNFVPTNFDPADPVIVAGGPDWDVASSLAYNTEAPPAGQPAGVDVQVPVMAYQIHLIRVGHFKVEGAAILTFQGLEPVLIVADTAEINGRIEALSGGGETTVSAMCAAGAGTGAANCGSGGAGGAFGGRGGGGGMCATAAGGSGRPANGDDTLVPLRGGCSGARGGSTLGTSGGATGGIGGGALQITARVSLVINNATIVAGGAAGEGSVSGGSGGGGAGAGGALLLESETLTRMAGLVCADGGGGGEGDDPGTTGGFRGINGCVINSGAGGTGSNGGDGGTGGKGTNFDAANGGNIANSIGAGGGGGSAGRIRIRAKVFQGNAVNVTPMPRVDQL